MFGWRCSRSRLATLLTVLIVVSPGTGNGVQSTTPRPVQQLPLDLITEPWIGDFDGMVRRRRIRLLTPYSKTHYFIDRGVQRGIVYDFGIKLEEEINRRLKTRPATRVHIVFVPMRKHELLEALLDGRGDVIASNLTIAAEQASYVDFTTAGQTNVKQILVSGPTSPPIQTTRVLGGLEVAVRERSTELESLAAFNSRLQQQSTEPVVIRTVPPELEDEDLLEMVSAGLVTATVVDDAIGDFWARVLPDLTLHRHVVVRDDGAVAWAVRKGSPRLLEMLNPIVEAHRIGTRFGNQTLQAYLRTASAIKRATAETELAKFQALTEVFRRIASRYDLDYLLMMAQAYQESEFDQRATSRKGAIGIMQVMPATAGELNVGDIRQIEPNVHAGVKYIRVIIDRHFNSESIDPLNQTLFAFAAYNCGPSRLRQLRRQTVRRGLNPNVWFDNVERIAGEVVGRQTVDYVSNIYKYYVAYRLAVMSMGAGDRTGSVASQSLEAQPRRTRAQSAIR
jgi:membrane-bound lytic murein transglycosylase MltF